VRRPDNLGSSFSLLDENRFLNSFYSRIAWTTLEGYNEGHEPLSRIAGASGAPPRWAGKQHQWMVKL
jgi:hypothetical protein